MSELNEKIFDAIEANCVGYGSNPTIGKQDAADAIEILVLQEKIDLLNECISADDHLTESNVSMKISELTNKLKELLSQK